MSTYNSKFSGAKIDELLEKVASGQVGGGGSSEKEDLAKEMGATHKHTITLDIGVMGVWFRCVTYTKDATPFTVETLTSAISDTSYLNAYGFVATNGVGAIVDGYFAVVNEGGEQSLAIVAGGIFNRYEFVYSVDFVNQSTNSTAAIIQAAERVTLVPLLIEHAGAIFTDDVTEL